MTQFQEQVAFQRGMEGELSRTVQAYRRSNRRACTWRFRNHRCSFATNRQPSASVLVNLHPGRTLDPGQVQSIVHLVSSSVPELSPSNVTVVDQAGNLLTNKADNASALGLNSNQLDYVRSIERNYAHSIEAIVSPIVGDGNVKAEVRADLDFSVSEATSESYRPNPTPDAQAVRSLQTVEDLNRAGNQAQGVPGALTNQPPGPATAPLNAPAGANAGPNTGAGQGEGSSSSRKENTTNFELDKTIRHTKEPLGRIKRLSVAVVINYKAGAWTKTALRPNRFRSPPPNWNRSTIW
jgi:flagellar M-ring protein FliF